MSILSHKAQAIKDLFPASAHIEGYIEVENHGETDTYGFTVTMSGEYGDEQASFRPEQLVELKKKLKAEYMFIYPSRPINPYEIRLFFYFSTPHEEESNDEN